MTGDQKINTLKKIHSGKVRDIYEYDQKKLLIVSSDRISAFDFVFEEEVLGKGSLLNKMSIFWFKKLKSIIKNHYLDIKPDFDQKIIEKSMIVEKTKVLPIEAIIRGHIAGSAWEEFEKTGNILGNEARSDMRKYDKLDEPIFTPTTKSEKDENISIEVMRNTIGSELSEKVIDASYKLYASAYEFAESKGLIIADTKFEFGIDDDGKLTLIDEIFTPDCSRFLKTSTIDGENSETFDKQFFRDFLIKNNWNQSQIKIPDNIKSQIIERYRLAYEIITN